MSKYLFYSGFCDVVDVGSLDRFADFADRARFSWRCAPNPPVAVFFMAFIPDPCEIGEMAKSTTALARIGARQLRQKRRGGSELTEEASEPALASTGRVGDGVGR